MERTALPRRLTWQLATVVETITETPRTKSLVLDVPQWTGHRAGQHVDVRLTAEDGYQAQRSYSIASAPEAARLMLTVHRLPDGEVSPYLVDEVRAGDQLELRGPIGGYFTWDESVGGPLLLIAGGSGVVPLMAMIRHRSVVHSTVPTRLLFSARSADDLIYHAELDRLASDDATLQVSYTLTRTQPPGWTGYARRIDGALIAEVAWPPEQGPRMYICGPTPLVESAATACMALGYDVRRIKTERFGASGGAG